MQIRGRRHGRAPGLGSTFGSRPRVQAGQRRESAAVGEQPLGCALLDDDAPVGDDDPETQLYRKAVQIVAESQKASTSYLQRQLRLGYNSAARLIERMEKDGLVGQPDHVGRREVLIDPEGHPI